MTEMICTTLEGCINSYTNNITRRIDNYNHYNNIGEFTSLKTCISKRKECTCIINIQYNTNIILGLIDIEDGFVKKIILSDEYYPNFDKTTRPQIERELNRIFKNSLLVDNNGDVILIGQ